MSSPSGNDNNSDKPLPPVPPYQQGTPRRRQDSIYTQSNARPICPSASPFGGDSQSSSTFYSFPRLPEEEPSSPTQLPRLPPVRRPGRTASFSERIASGIRSLIGRDQPGEEKGPLLSMSREEYEAGKQQKTADGAHVFCQHVFNESCQCTVTIPIAVGRNLCQTCSDGKCAAVLPGSNPNQELRCRHLWDDKCQCQRFALWITGDELCGPCWYGQCQGEASTEPNKDNTAQQ